MIAGISPDGAADGQCALNSVTTLAEKVDTCNLHQLQRAVLFGIGLAGVSCKNPEAKTVLRKHNRVVMLTRQSLSVGKDLRDRQIAAGVPDHEIKTLVPTALTRWGNQFLQITRNCELRPGLEPAVQKYVREHKNEKRRSSRRTGPTVAAAGAVAAGARLEHVRLGAERRARGLPLLPFQIRRASRSAAVCTGHRRWRCCMT